MSCDNLQGGCGPDDCSNPTLILQQGSTFSFPFAFHAGPRYDIQSSQPGSGPTITTVHPHCLTPGDTVHIVHQTVNPCGGDGGCAEVAAVIDDNTVTLSNYVTTSPGGQNGYIVKALDLTGIRLCGAARTRPINQMISTSGIKASGFAGAPELLLDGTCDVKVGDSITISNIGLFNARVKAVFKQQATAPTQTAVTSVNSSRCGCAIRPTESVLDGAGQCDSVLVILDQVLPQQLFEETGVDIQGNELFKFQFNYQNDDPKCGIIHAQVTGLDTKSIPVQVVGDGCSDRAYSVGYYSICLKRGWGDKVPSHYPEANYDSDVINLRTGELFIQASYC